MSPDLDAHVRSVVQALERGRLVPFLGAGANLCDRPQGVGWQAGQSQHLPHGGELAKHLAGVFHYPGTPPDLARVSQYAAVIEGTGPLYDELHTLFDADYPASALHTFLAALPARLRSRRLPRTTDPLYRRLITVTTNYDDLLDRAFAAAGEPFHFLWYMADGEQRGSFFHRTPAGATHRVEKPNEYRGLVADEHPVILKLHGALDRRDKEWDSFVITEDHYIEYLTRTTLENLVPVPLPAVLKNSHLLFLGYGLQDWNLRVILHRLWGDRKLSWQSWAIQVNTNEVDQKFWDKREVKILDVPLSTYVAALDAAIDGPPVAEAAP